MTFADLCSVAEKDESLRMELGFSSKNQTNGKLGPIKRLRDDVAHPVRSLINVDRSVTDLAESGHLLRSMLVHLGASAVGSTSLST